MFFSSRQLPYHEHIERQETQYIGLLDVVTSFYILHLHVKKKREIKKIKIKIYKEKKIKNKKGYKKMNMRKMTKI